MKTPIFIIFILIFSFNVFPQAETLSNIKKTANKYFDEGVELFIAGKNLEAKAKFEKATQYLLSVDVKAEERPELLEFLEKLSDRIYEIEFGEKPPPKSKADAGKKSIGFNNQGFDPTNDPLSKPLPSDEEVLGKKPIQAKDGKVQAVMDFFNENFNDPYSMRFVRWSNVERINVNSEPFWLVKVKFRAKNGFGAYILTEAFFYIRDNVVVKTRGI